MPTVTLMRSCPGGGKSTWVKQNRPLSRVCSADLYFTDPKTGEYRFDPKKLGEAHAFCLRRFHYFIGEGFDVVVDNTNTTAVEMAPYVAYTLAIGADIEIVHLKCDPFLAAKRNTHGVPENAVLSMHARLQDPLPHHWPKETIVQAGI